MIMRLFGCECIIVKFDSALNIGCWTLGHEFALG